MSPNAGRPKVIPQTKTKNGDAAFCVAGPRLRNQLFKHSVHFWTNSQNLLL